MGNRGALTAMTQMTNGKGHPGLLASCCSLFSFRLDSTSLLWVLTYANSKSPTHLYICKDARLKFIKEKRMGRTTHKNKAKKAKKEKKNNKKKKLQREHRKSKGKAVVTGQATLNSFVIYMSRFRRLKMWLELLAFALALA